MKIAFKHQALKKKNSDTCFVTEYALGHKMLDIAISVLAGRYPDTRHAVNQQCDELAYVIEGSGKVVVNQQEHLLSAGDAVLIEAGEKYFLEGNMKLYISCSPAWTPEQHEYVD